MEHLEFQYIKTYSGFRGELFTKQVNDIESEINELEMGFKSEKDFKTRFNLKHKIKHLKSDLEKLDVYNNRLIDSKNNLHKWAKEVGTIQKDSEIANQMFSIFTNNRVEESFVVTTCPPIYRDAIVFFNKNQIIKIIHCCFECINFIDENNNSIFLNLEGIEQLRNLLINIGHKID